MDVQKSELTQEIQKLSDTLSIANKMLANILNSIASIREAKIHQLDSNSKPLCQKIQTTLNNLNVPRSQLGYRYIQDSLELIIHELNTDPLFRLKTTTWLYPTIAKKNSSNPKRIERDIRHSINYLSINSSDSLLYKELFPEYSNKVPTNTEFLSRLIMYLTE